MSKGIEKFVDKIEKLFEIINRNRLVQSGGNEPKSFEKTDHSYFIKIDVCKN